jgi:hypothetical protein
MMGGAGMTRLSTVGRPRPFKEDPTADDLVV